MFQQRVWILQRSNIEILRECQRLIMDQFAERISLTQSDIIDRIFYFHGKSSNQRFHEAVERLKMSLMEAAFDLRQLPSYEEPEGPHSFQPDTYQPEALHADTLATASTQPPKNRQRVYRGQKVVIENQSSPHSAQPNDSELTAALANPMGSVASSKSRKRIYRGRVIEG
ncbi:MAG: hypothetical protein MI976_22495 [Pseudomonadales bacterium]|nr:hypothetical protein [Pseudomonadales bacterium]